MTRDRFTNRLYLSLLQPKSDSIFLRSITLLDVNTGKCAYKTGAAQKVHQEPNGHILEDRQKGIRFQSVKVSWSHESLTMRSEVHMET